MIRTVVIIRHAKSSWANPLQSDFERPLNERGKHDAPMMGKRLFEKNIIPDVVISSTAKRAMSTAKKISEQLNYPESSIVYYDKLYHCVPSVFEEVIYEIDDKHQIAFIVAHNPGITGFANQLSHSFYTDNMPTCGIVAATFNAESWSEFSSAEKKVILFDYPKNYDDQ